MATTDLDLDKKHIANLQTVVDASFVYERIAVVDEVRTIVRAGHCGYYLRLWQTDRCNQFGMIY